MVSGLAALALIAAAAPAAAADVMIHLTSSNAYLPPSQPVKAGDKIVWINDADVQHTVTPDNGQPAPFPASPVLKKKGDTHKWTVAGKPRTIKYHCKIHGAAMSGEIVVGP
jgi:plastocyanin